MRSRIMVICAIAVVATFVGAAGFKIGYINSETLRKEYGAFKDAQAQFDKEVSGWQNEAASMEKELVDLQSELEQQSLLLSEEKKHEREMVIDQKKKEYQQYLADIFGTGGRAERRNSELTAPLLEKINQALVDIAQSEGYDLILDVAGGNIAYIDENLDITDKLLAELEGKVGD